MIRKSFFHTGYALILVSTLFCLSAHPNKSTFDTLAKHIEQCDIVAFQAKYEPTVITTNEKKQLRRLATDIEVRLKEIISEQTRMLDAGVGTLCLVGSALTLSPILVNSTLCICGRTTKYWRNPPFFVEAPLHIVYKLAQLTDSPFRHNADMVDRFLGTNDTQGKICFGHLLTLYCVCAGNGGLLGLAEVLLIKRAMISKKYLDIRIKNLQQIARLLSKSIELEIEVPLLTPLESVEPKNS